MNITKTCMKKEEYKALKACMSKDINRYQLQSMNFQKDSDGMAYIESTDGKMLMRLYIDHEVGIGAYKVIGEVKLGAGLVELTLEKLDLQYPDTNAIMPKANDEYLLLGIDANDLGISSAMLKVYQYTGNAVAYELLEKLSILDNAWDVYKYGIGKSNLYLANQGKYIALIMPFHLNELKIEKKELANVA